MLGWEGGDIFFQLPFDHGLLSKDKGAIFTFRWMLELDFCDINKLAAKHLEAAQKAALEEDGWDVWFWAMVWGSWAMPAKEMPL